MGGLKTRAPGLGRLARCRHSAGSGLLRQSWSLAFGAHGPHASRPSCALRLMDDKPSGAAPSPPPPTGDGYEWPLLVGLVLCGFILICMAHARLLAWCRNVKSDLEEPAFDPAGRSTTSLTTHHIVRELSSGFIFARAAPQAQSVTQPASRTAKHKAKHCRQVLHPAAAEQSDTASTAGGVSAECSVAHQPEHRPASAAFERQSKRKSTRGRGADSLDRVNGDDPFARSRTLQTTWVSFYDIFTGSSQLFTPTWLVQARLRLRHCELPAPTRRSTFSGPALTDSAALQMRVSRLTPFFQRQIVQSV